MKLHEIQYHIDEILDHGFTVVEETGEAFDINNLNELQIMEEEKIENITLYRKNVDVMAKAIRQEEIALSERRKKMESRIERIDAYLTNQLIASCRKKYESPRCRLSFIKSTTTEIDDISALPDDLVDIIPEQRKPIKSEIKKAIKSGREVPGAHLIERENLQVK